MGDGVDIAGAPALAKVVAHAHRRGGLGIAPCIEKHGHVRRRGPCGVLGRDLGERLVDDTEHDQKGRPDEGASASIG